MRIISLILAAGLGLGCTAANAQLQADPGSDSSEGTPWADLKAQAEAEKAVYEAQAEAAKAQQAVYEAQAAAMKAKFGNISGEGGTAGALTVDEDGNKPEGMLRPPISMVRRRWSSISGSPRSAPRSMPPPSSTATRFRRRRKRPPSMQEPRTAGEPSGSRRRARSWTRS